MGGFTDLKIENLTFTYPEREKPALDDINLTIKQGEFVVLCGKSSCGKTTLLRQLSANRMARHLIPNARHRERRYHGSRRRNPGRNEK